MSLSAKGRPRNCRTPRTPLRLDESRFAVRTEVRKNPIVTAIHHNAVAMKIKGIVFQ